MKNILSLLMMMFLLASGIFSISSCSNPTSPRGIEEYYEHNEDENSESDGEDASNGTNGDDNQDTEDTTNEEENGDNESEVIADPHSPEFYESHPELTEGTILVDDFWIEPLISGSDTKVKVKLYNHFQKTILVRLALSGSSAIIEHYAPFGYSITEELLMNVPEGLEGWHNLMITVLDMDYNVLFHDSKSWFVQVR